MTGAARVRDQAAQAQYLAFERRMGRDRHLASAFELPVEGAFGEHARSGARACERRNQRLDHIVSATAFDAQRPLPRRRQHRRHVERLGHPRAMPAALETGDGEHDRVEVALIEPPQTGVDTAAQVLDAQIRPMRGELAPAAQARRADRRAGRQRPVGPHKGVEMSIRVGIVMDPVASIIVQKDTTLAMRRRGTSRAR